MAVNKEVDLELHLIFGVTGDSTEEVKEDCALFLRWVREQFTQWDESILQYFLYEYNLVQDGRYTLDLHIDRILNNGAQDETTGNTKKSKPKTLDTTVYDDLAESDYDELLEQGQEDYLHDSTRPSDTSKLPRPTQGVEVPNPQEQVMDVLKKRDKKRKQRLRKKDR